ncbi:MAG: hypothetical protein NXI01_05135 [Gammaproteobacteria bacterium]|nr:hypothetical protein [Gammaproteobacteria bacterium]
MNEAHDAPSKIQSGIVMKKYLVVFFIGWGLVASHAFADKAFNGDNLLFHISIYNNMPYNCDLISQATTRGQVLLPTPIPVYLAPGSINRFTMSERNNEGASIALAYQCEGNRSITIFSHSRLSFRRRGNHIKHGVPNAQNMRAIVTSQNQNFFKSFSEIGWVFLKND